MLFYKINLYFITCHLVFLPEEMQRKLKQAKICGALRELVPFVQFKNVKNTYGGVLILVKLLASACNFAKINTPPWVLFTFFKLYK